MKKSLFAVCTLLLALSASAVSVNWSGNKSTSTFKGLTSGSDLTGGAGSETASITVYYILYSNYDSLVEKGAALDEDAFKDLNLAVATATGNNTNANAKGRIGVSSATKDFETAGINYFARAYATIGGESYFMDVFGGSGNGGVWTTTQNGDEVVTESLAWANGTYGGGLTTTVGTKNTWVGVTSDPGTIPEPATGALALAGVALLFKRRRA